MQAQTTLADKLIAMLTALAVFFRELADAFLRWADQIRTEGLTQSPGRTPTEEIG